MTDEKKVNAERIKYWISKGAQPSGTVHNYLVNERIIAGKKINVLPRRTPIKKEEPPKSEVASGQAPKSEGASEQAPKVEVATASTQDTEAKTEAPAETPFEKPKA